MRTQILLWILLLNALAPVGLKAQNEGAKQKLDAYFSKNAAKLNLENRDISGLFVTKSYTDPATGIQHIYAQQRINGIDVVGGVFALHSSEKVAKEIAANNLFSTKGVSAPGSGAAIGAEQAVRKALTEAKYPESVAITVKETGENKTIFKRSDVAAMDIPARKVYLPKLKQKTLQLAWEVQLFDAVGRHYWIMFIDATSGQLISKRDAVIHCRFDSPLYEADHTAHLTKSIQESNAVQNKLKSDHTYTPVPFATANNYRVFPLPYEAPHDLNTNPFSFPHPLHQLTPNAGHPTGSPDGWHRIAAGAVQPYAWGNNVWAFYDPAPTPLGGTPPNQATSAVPTSVTPVTIEPMTFDYPFNPNIEPDSSSGIPPQFNNRNAAIVNLFYWNNLMHDVFYQHGFTEASRNFQASHVFSTGPRAPAQGEGDPVWAQAQDGGGTNNANFLTLADGVPGSAQMQMYLWTQASQGQLVQITSSAPSGNPPSGTKYNAVQGSFSTAPTARDTNDLFHHPVLNRQFVVIKKNPLSTVGTDSQGCSTGQQSIALPPGNDVANKIVLIDRGGCSFVEKVLGAQEGGAAGVIVINNVPGPPIAMGGSDGPTNLIHIPAVMISLEDGTFLKSRIAAGDVIIGSLKRDSQYEPKRDGDFDNAVIAHEYGHGISNRLTGSGILPLYGDEQGGEGWSDFMGLYMITRKDDLLPADGTHPNGILPDKGLGTYLTYQPLNGQGIRPTKYSVTSTPQYTFKDINNPEISIPHGVGTIWCYMLYNMEQELINIYGFNDDIYNGATPVSVPGAPPAGAGGNNVAMRLVMEGMKLQPEGPTFQQQRDAILAADSMLYNGMHSCAIWRAFAKLGLGFSAQSNSNGVGDEVEGYDLPQSCLLNQTNFTLDVKSPTRALSGGVITDSIRVRNTFSTLINNLLVVDTVSQNINITGTNPAANSIVTVGDKKVVTWISSLTGNQEKVFTVTGTINIPTAGTQLFFDNHEDGAGGWTPVSTNPTANWSIQTTKPYSGTNHWYVRNLDPNIPASDHYLQMNNDVPIPAGGAELVFLHFYNTETGFDGGSVEVSNDGGVTWTYLPNSKFVRNGYNGVIPTTNTPNYLNGWAFTGTSPGYITSIANLGDYAGQNVRVRFRFVQDVATRQDGWYIDDVYLMTNRTEITNVALARAGSDPAFSTILAQQVDSTSTFVFGSGAVLPVNGAELKVKTGSNAIQLNWVTIDENGVDKFEVERQAQNESTFKWIGEVKAAGTTRGRTTYNLDDKNVQPNILYSYRIKMIDQNNSIRYTNLVTAKIGDGKAFGFTVMPNPASSNMRLTYNHQLSETAMLRVFDAGGKLITTWSVGKQNSVSTNINVSTFGNGVYWLELEDNGLKQTQKLIIQR